MFEVESDASDKVRLNRNYLLQLMGSLLSLFFRESDSENTENEMERDAEDQVEEVASIDDMSDNASDSEDSDSAASEEENSSGYVTEEDDELDAEMEAEFAAESEEAGALVGSVPRPVPHLPNELWIKIAEFASPACPEDTDCPNHCCHSCPKYRQIRYGSENDLLTLVSLELTCLSFLNLLSDACYAKSTSRPTSSACPVSGAAWNSGRPLTLKSRNSGNNSTSSSPQNPPLRVSTTLRFSSAVWSSLTIPSTPRLCGNSRCSPSQSSQT